MRYVGHLCLYWANGTPYCLIKYIVYLLIAMARITTKQLPPDSSCATNCSLYLNNNAGVDYTQVRELL